MQVRIPRTAWWIYQYTTALHSTAMWCIMGHSAICHSRSPRVAQCELRHPTGQLTAGYARMIWPDHSAAGRPRGCCRMGHRGCQAVQVRHSTDLVSRRGLSLSWEVQRKLLSSSRAEDAASDSSVGHISSSRNRLACRGVGKESRTLTLTLTLTLTCRSTTAACQNRL